MSTPILAAENVGRTFGGFVALEGVTATFQSGKVTSIIGPNGAGKSTFFNVLSGVLTPTSGSIRFKGRDLGRTRQHEFVHLGIARSYQITNIFPELSAHENVRVAAQAGRSRYNIWTNRAGLNDLSERAEATQTWRCVPAPQRRTYRDWLVHPPLLVAVQNSLPSGQPNRRHPMP